MLAGRARIQGDPAVLRDEPAAPDHHQRPPARPARLQDLPDGTPGGRRDGSPGARPDGPDGALRARLAGIARSAGMALCGAGCMGFANVACGLRAIGYIEPDPLPAGPVAMMTHSGSVFSALLRARRGFGFSVAVSSRQELVTSAAPHRRRATSE